MRRYLFALLFAVFSLSSCSSGIKVISYNVGTFTKSGADCTQLIADMLSEEKADFIGLCELDSCTVRTAGKYQLEELAEALKGDYQVVFAPALAFQGGKYGIGMLVRSDRDLLSTEVVELEKSDGAEQRVLCIAQTPEVVFAVTHLDHKGVQARMDQCVQITEVLEKLAEDTGKEVILCGDFNSTPGSEEVKYLKRHWIQVSPSENTYPSDAPRECIDYVFVLKGSRLSCRDGRVVDNTKTFDAVRASDHLAVCVDLR